MQNQHNDETGRLASSMNVMVEKISLLIGQTKGLAKSVYDASAQLAGSTEYSAKVMEGLTKKAQDLSEVASYQANLAGRTRTVMEEMLVGVQQVATSSSSVAATAQAATSAAVAGGDQIEKAVDQMKVINAAVSDTADVVRTLGSKSEEIGQIVDVISAIAGQTNLLALNAAIEAARAGEQGRGFAVVADEVRQLAEESHTAAQQISTRIKDIQDETAKAVKAMDQGTREVSGGLEAVGNAGTAFDKIIAAIQQVSDQIQQVSAASQQMSAGTETAIESVNITASTADKTSNAAQEINALIEEQMAGLEEIDAATEKLHDLVHNMDQIIQIFKVKEL